MSQSNLGNAQLQQMGSNVPRINAGHATSAANTEELKEHWTGQGLADFRSWSIYISKWMHLMDEIQQITQDCSIHLVLCHTLYFKSLAPHGFLAKGSGPRDPHASVAVTAYHISSITASPQQGGQKEKAKLEKRDWLDIFPFLASKSHFSITVHDRQEYDRPYC